MSENRDVRARWGTDAEYYAELREFSEKHRDAARIVVDKKLGCPVRAEYDFRPHAAFVEHRDLLERLRITAKWNDWRRRNGELPDYPEDPD